LFADFDLHVLLTISSEASDRSSFDKLNSFYFF